MSEASESLSKALIRKLKSPKHFCEGLCMKVSIQVKTFFKDPLTKALEEMP
ncbi:hypothetical protein ECDEC11A_1428 [Escherichia coli DEC11A]|nr:hypothetical protein ECDEC11A_1428 [Escherichia coli DEC11A]